MKTEHYPDQKRCETLTSLGFPETELVYCNVWTESHRWIDYDFNSYHILDELYIIPRLPTWRYCSREDYPFDDTKILQYRCPSIAELLDPIPHTIIREWKTYFLKIEPDFFSSAFGAWACYYIHDIDESMTESNVLVYRSHTPLPNSLSDLIIWLTQNWYKFENWILICN